MRLIPRLTSNLAVPPLPASHSTAHKRGICASRGQGYSNDRGPAARANLAPGDLIIAAGDRPVGGMDDLFDALRAARGGTLQLAVVRGTDERTIQVMLGGL